MELTAHLVVIGGEKRWVLAAFDESGARYSDCTPAGDLYAPVPDVYKTPEAAAAALAVVAVWSEDQSLEELRDTDEWRALEDQIADTSVPQCTEDDFGDDNEAFEHYKEMIDKGSVVRFDGIEAEAEVIEAEEET
jgi:hypothetical protein